MINRDRRISQSQDAIELGGDKRQARLLDRLGEFLVLDPDASIIQFRKDGRENIKYESLPHPRSNSQITYARTKDHNTIAECNRIYLFMESVA